MIFNVLHLEQKHTMMHLTCLKLHEDVSFEKKLDMCLWNTDAPGGNKVKYGKNL